MKRVLLIAAAVFCLATPAMAQMDFTAQAVIITVANMGPRIPVPDVDPCSCDKVKKVAIISMLDRTITYRKNAGSVAQFDISPWALDGVMSGLLNKYLAGRFEIVDQPMDTEALAKGGASQSQVKAWLKTQPTPAVDAYIVVRPSKGIDLGDETWPGQASVAPNYVLDIVDARTLRTLGSAEARVRYREHGGAYFPHQMLTGVSPSDVIAGKDGASAELLRRAVVGLLQKSIVEVLRDLKIGLSLPGAGDRALVEPYFAPDMKGFKSVGVLSAIGDSISLVDVGNGYGKSTNDTLDTASWQIDDAAEKIARDVLSRHYQVKDITQPRPALAEQTITTSPPFAVTGLTASREVDAYVLILKAEMPATQRRGIGAWHKTPLFNKEAAVFTNYAVVVVNATSLKPVAFWMAAQADKPPCAQPTRYSTGAPECIIAEKSWPADLKAVPAATQDLLRENLKNALAGSLPETLYQLGLDWPPAQ